VQLVEAVLSMQLDDPEPTLARRSYRLRDLAEQFDAKPAEIKAWLTHPLESAGASEPRKRRPACRLDPAHGGLGCSTCLC
jgi:hypothetical protein